MSKRNAAMLGLLILLTAANIATGAALVMTTTKSRALFQEYELLQSEEDRLQGEWSALRLEVGTLAGHSEIDRIARDELGMVDPDDQLHYVRTAR